MFKACTLVSFTSLLALLSICENYGYFKKVYIELSNQTAVDERLAADGSAGGWTLESIEAAAMALMVCASSVFFWRDFSRYRTLFGHDAKEEIKTKLVCIREEIENRLKILEDKIDELFSRLSSGDVRCVCLTPVDHQMETLSVEEELPSCADVETIYSRPDGGCVHQEMSATVTIDACQADQGLGVDQGSQTSCPRIATKDSTQQTAAVAVAEEEAEGEEDSRRSVCSLPTTREGTGDVPARGPASWYEEVRKEEEILMSRQVGGVDDSSLADLVGEETVGRGEYKGVFGSEGSTGEAVSPGCGEFEEVEAFMESHYRRIPRYQGAKKGYARQYHNHGKPMAAPKPSEASRPTTPRHYTSPEAAESGQGTPNRRRKQRNYNPKQNGTI